MVYFMNLYYQDKHVVTVSIFNMFSQTSFVSFMCSYRLIKNNFLKGEFAKTNPQLEFNLKPIPKLE